MEKITLLLVDDDPGIVAVARVALERVGGFSVESASDPSEAVSRLSECRFSVVLMDVRLGMCSCMDVLDWLDQHAPAMTNVFLFSAAVGEAWQVARGRPNIRGVVEKPFDPLRMPLDLLAEIGRASDGENSINRGKSADGDGLEDLWSRHRGSVLADIESLRLSIEAMQTEGRGLSGENGPMKSALETAHRLHGALGVYGWSRESSMAGEIYSLLRPGKEGQILPRCASLTRTLWDSIAGDAMESR